MSYAGDVSSIEAHDAVAAGEAILVDCRTEGEWESVGVPAVDAVVFVEWNRQSGVPNPGFLDEVRRAGVDPDDPVYFLCRSGQRSRAAAVAATAAGFRAAYNVADGFEGPPGPDGSRDVAGWKVAGLPWRRA